MDAARNGALHTIQIGLTMRLGALDDTAGDCLQCSNGQPCSILLGVRQHGLGGRTDAE